MQGRKSRRPCCPLESNGADSSRTMWVKQLMVSSKAAVRADIVSDAVVIVANAITLFIIQPQSDPLSDLVCYVLYWFSHHQSEELGVFV